MLLFKHSYFYLCCWLKLSVREGQTYQKVLALSTPAGINPSQVQCMVCVVQLLHISTVHVWCLYCFLQSEGASTGILSGKSFSECWRDPVMSWLCGMTAETLTGFKTEREVNAPMKIKSCSLEARKETQFDTCCRYLEASSSPRTWREDGMVDIYSLISWESLDKILCWSKLGDGFHLNGTVLN